MTSEILLKIESLIKKDIKKLSESCPDRQMAVIQLVRTMDYYLLGSLFDIEEQRESLISFCYGFSTAFYIFYEDLVLNERFPFFPNNQGVFSWANSLLKYSSKLASVKLSIEHSRTNLAKVEYNGNDEFLFTYPNKIVGVESLEKMEFFWIADYKRRKNNEGYEALEEKAESIHKMMGENSFILDEYFIGYNTTTQVDDFYLKLSELELSIKLGFDSFPLKTLFDGIPFKVYLDALNIFNSLSLKHLGYVTSQLKKGGKVDSVNLLQYVMQKSDVEKTLIEKMGVDMRTSEKLLDILTLGKSKKSLIFSKVDGAFPPFIEISKKHVLFFHSGFKAEPVMFLLDGLKSRYQKDWDRALDSREGIFRSELYSFFTNDRFIKIDRPIIIKVSGRVLTDIDGFIYDKITGTLALFQLKWQEPFANSMFERNSRKRNFERESDHWINLIEGWLESKTSNELAASFGLKSELLKEYKKSILFIIGRNFAHFSGDAPPNEGAAWGLWPQIVRLLHENTYSDNDPLLWFHKLLKQDNPVAKSLDLKDELKNYTIELSDYKININWC